MAPGKEGQEEADTSQKVERSLFWDTALSAFYIVLWISLSSTVILFNKWILSYGGFPYPITLTIWHMAFSSVLAFVIVQTGIVTAPTLPKGLYLRGIIPVGALFAGTLWLGNEAYLYLSVSFIQMVKAMMPVVVYLVGCCFGTEQFRVQLLVNMMVVTAGISIASYGEANFVLIGFLYQVSSLLTESTRITMVQLLLQRKGLSLNPISTMYYIAPASFLFLSLPWAILEGRQLIKDPTVTIDVPVLLASAVVAFALNISIFLLIGKTSALTMNVSGVLKDWLLIMLSVVLFQSQITPLNITGYSLAFAGVSWYNWTKLRMAKQRAAEASTAKSGKPVDVEEPLLEKPLQRGGSAVSARTANASSVAAK